ncbi:MAG: helix-turn-helix domain-containing protein [Actinomadura sp.]
MIAAEFRTEDLPVSERFGFWHDMTADALIPTAFRSEHRDDFRATLRALDLGAIQVTSMTYPSLETRRTPKLIRRSDPELYQMALTLRGAQRIAQVGRDTSLGPYDLMLYDSSRPFVGRVAADAGGTVAAVVAQVPKALFSLPLDRVDRLLAVRMPGREGVGALLAQFLMGVTAGAGRLRPSDASRLGTVLLDLVVALLAHELEADSSVPPESHRRALILRIQAFIRQHIGEPKLGPAMIATAHHISVRHLHRLFREEGVTVAGWIRVRRLERCRRDLADPALFMTPIHEIAMRWGFSHPAAFSRAFRSAYGLSPRDFRQHSQDGEGAER